LEEGARLLRNQLASGAVSLLFGSEKRGLSNHDLSHCHWLMRIPTRDEHSSMNLGQAVAVCLYELVRGMQHTVTSPEPLPATAGDSERITSTLFQSLCASGYVNPAASSTAEEKLRRLVLRLNLQAGDAEVWLGMLRQILWKIQSQENPK